MDGVGAATRQSDAAHAVDDVHLAVGLRIERAAVGEFLRSAIAFVGRTGAVPGADAGEVDVVERAVEIEHAQNVAVADDGLFFVMMNVAGRIARVTARGAARPRHGGGRVAVIVTGIAVEIQGQIINRAVAGTGHGGAEHVVLVGDTARQCRDDRRIRRARAARLDVA